MFGREKWIVTFFSFLLFHAPIVIGESIVDLGRVVSLHDSDVGLENAVISNNRAIVLAF